MTARVFAPPDYTRRTDRMLSELLAQGALKIRRFEMLRKCSLFLVLSVFGVLSINAIAMGADDGKTGPEVGQKAPDFKLPYATQEVTQYKAQEGMGMAQYHGKIVVLAFYPADWSGGCTTEMCTFRDTFGDLGNLGAVILGISGDYVF